MDWKKIQNGSDIRGIALEGIEGENVNLTNEVANAIAKAFVAWLKEKNGKTMQTVAVGSDSRLSSPAIREAFAEGASGTGAQVLEFGMASTPAMFMSTVDKDLKVDGAVMVTASHLPWNRNGLKFFTTEGGLDKGDIKRILELAPDFYNVENTNKGKIEKVDFMDTYCRILTDYIREGAGIGNEPLKGMKIVVDAGNGAGGFFAHKVLDNLGADTSASQFLEPDGHFPNHVPNPEDKAAMASICKAVVEQKADLGIIFDTDVDRSAIVGRTGAPINRNALIALIATVILREHPGSTIVTDSVTSDGLAEFIAAKGGIHHRFRRGYKNVINESLRLNEANEESWLAIETSGHAALRENYFLDDGAYLVAKLLVEAARLRTEGKELQDLISDLREPAESKEIRFKIATDNFKEYGQKVLEDLQNKIEKQADWKIVAPNHEGIRIACTAENEKGWFLLRQSLHDPVLPLNIESDVEGGVARIEQRVLGLLSAHSELKH
ncbi:phosphoglucomutase [Prevotella sp. HUN102]|uniref:phosphoglucomutase n=1 Tax=Prevotella sp. HUN102 TaxID=1392486 RepID=UPI00048F1EDE|nr:phosphoglucomutase [Prevotella sp. HUN102]